MNSESKILVLGASGMLGNAVLRFFAKSPGYSAVGSVRSEGAAALLRQLSCTSVISGVNVEDSDSLVRLFADVKPQVVINCVGLVKQLASVEDPLTAIPINSLLPHRLARLCGIGGARLIHISTDCVFAGTRGMYREEDSADANDLYGRSKFMGEVDCAQAVTLRTSIIGHELGNAHGLIGWFLSQRNGVQGYQRAIFSGLPTVELARVIRDFVIPNADLHGLYHVASAAINKYDLLSLVAQVYASSIKIEPDDRVIVDRSLDATRFRERTGYVAPAWPELVRAMREFG
jgi:dTDP-4-dehydrorhamnose reductase